MSCHWLDPRYLDELAALDPADVCRRSTAEWDDATSTYRLKVLCRTAVVDAAGRSVTWAEGSNAGASLTLELALAALFFLIKAEVCEPSGEWVSEKQLEGGLYLFQGTHQLPLQLISTRFGDDREGFLASGAALGGRPVEGGDAAIELPALPRVPVLVQLWRGDDEFPAEAKMLFDSTIDRHLPLDVIYGLAVDLCRIIGC